MTEEKHLFAELRLIIKEGKIILDSEDEIIKSTSLNLENKDE